MPETAIVHALKELLKDYEQRAERVESSVCGSVRKQFRKAAEDDRYLTRLLIDPEDRKPVQYFDEETLIKFLRGDRDEVKKRKFKSKLLKQDKPLVKILPLIEAVRAKRYKHLTEIFVWDCHVEHDDISALSGMISQRFYSLSHIEMVDCLLTIKSISLLASSVAQSRTIKTLVLDFNEIGESGCRVLCSELFKSAWLVHLSLAYCGLTKLCGLWLGNLVTRTAIRELGLDGNRLEAEGAIALLSQLAEAAENEYLMQIIQESSATKQTKQTVQYLQETALESVAEKPPQEAQASENPDPNEKKSSKRGKKGKGRKPEPPVAGPQISILLLGSNGIDFLDGGHFAPMRCMQLFKSLIAYSRDLQEINLFGNELGGLGANQILEGLLMRRDAKLPQIGITMGHNINQDVFDVIQKLAPGPKKKRRGRKKKVG